MQSHTNISFVFFGTSEFSRIVLDTLSTYGFLPSLIATTPDSRQGRGLTLTPPPVKIWAKEKNIPFVQSEKLDLDFANKLKNRNDNLFVVASYGKIIPAFIFSIPPHGTLNIHPSLLPKLRGATPIQSAILGEAKTGVSIIKIDAEVDHGPLLGKKEVAFGTWPVPYSEAEQTLATAGSKLLAEILPNWVSGNIKEEEQNHSEATFTKKIEKKDGEISLNDSGDINYRKFCAYREWPGTYFFLERDQKKVRINIKEASFQNGTFNIERVIPEGKKEMNYTDFMRGFKK